MSESKLYTPLALTSVGTEHVGSVSTVTLKLTSLAGAKFREPLNGRFGGMEENAATAFISELIADYLARLNAIRLGE